MNIFKRYCKTLFFHFIEIIIFLLLLTLLYYFNVISSNTYKVLKFLLLMITIFINSFILGKSAKHRGYQEGIRYGFIITIFFIIIALVGKQWKSNLFILYSMIFLTSILGSIMGIQKKES